MVLKNILYGTLRRNTLKIRNCGKNIILSSPVRHESAVNLEGGILEVILLSYEKLFGKLYHQSMIMRSKSLERRKSCLYRVLGSSERSQVR